MAIIARNTDTEDPLVVYISAGKSVTIPAASELDLLYYATKEEVAKSDVAFHIEQGNLTINDGTKDLTTLNALKLVWNLSLQPTNVTADGDWHMVQENFAHVTGNKIVNWTVEKFLDAQAEYSEKFLIPDGYTLTVNFVEAGSSTVPTTVVLEYYDWINETLHRINPELRVEETFLLTVDGAFTTDDTELTVADTDTNTIQELETGMTYGFKDGVNDVFYRTIVDITTGTSSITLDSGIPTDIADGTMIGLVDRVIGQKGTKSASGMISWVSPPRFFGDGDRYLRLRIENDDPTDGGLVAGTLNGWLTPTADGD